ncbi:MAG: sugar ABC transporter permease [Candidatus Fournierella pullistercoris]|uniref:Sugar ABC transporter permease n=1 Tax=Candidatus Allofournierella pullistercoris TaxID=2838597 RepID=A0A948T1L9_9FIRM|nr:sugar ABC transporter permease [Candidatus Fournierella pullistercoris]
MNKTRTVSYSKWGYIFLIPFFLSFAIFSLYPLATTVYYSFFEYYRSGLKEIGPNFVGLQNYLAMFSEVPQYFGNTILMWLMGFIPQITVALLLAAWLTDLRLRLRFQGFFKTVIYMPNLIMASAFAMLFFTLFSESSSGPINSILMNLGIIDQPIRFMTYVWGSRGLVALMNFLMWFGNTTIILIASIMGVDPVLYEAADLDGCTSGQMFWKITLPLIRPMLVYTFITSLVGGLQMFDVPQILSNGQGTPNKSTMTVIMYLNQHLFSKNYGAAGAISVLLFLICGALCVLVYWSQTREDV